MNILILIILIIFPTLSHATSWKIDDLYTFTTSTNGSAGIVDADSVPTYRIYEDETGTAVLTGSMAKLDDAGTTGFYSEQITLSAANGFEKGKSYNIIICAAISSTTACATEIFQVEMEVDSNTVSGTVATVTSITNGVTLADDSITAAKIAAGAIGSSELSPTAGHSYCDVTASVSGTDFEVGSCYDLQGNAVTLVNDSFNGLMMYAYSNGTGTCNVNGQGILVQDGILDVANLDIVPVSTSPANSGFKAAPNSVTTNGCGMVIK